MNLQNLSVEIHNQSKTIEEVFMDFSTEFPQLLGSGKSSSLDTLLETLQTLDKENTLSGRTETTHFTNYEEKYAGLFKELNEKIQNLSLINTDISHIKNDSEEMELIALNAMVVSIKSGDKGRAFSKITENLQQLSSSMIALSARLSNEESSLINNVNTLKDLFQEITSCQHNISEISSTEMNKIATCIARSSAPLQEMKQLSQSIYPHIQGAMEGLQLQDIIKQAFDHVIMCFDQFVDEDSIDHNEEKLDTIAFNISLSEIAQDVLQDIGNHLKQASDIFKKKWELVENILNQTEEFRSDYVHNFSHSATSTGEMSIVAQLESATEGFQELLKYFSQFQGIQKKVVTVCRNIIDRAHGMYDVFASLRPVISRLQHVRILQQIEVSKNDAVMAVKDLVTDMDNLIMDSSNSLDTMQVTIEAFISEISDMISVFTKTMADDNAKMSEVRTEKVAFFNSIQTLQDRIYSLLQHFTVYPPEFKQQCDHVNTMLGQLQSIQTDFDRINSQIGNEIQRLSNKKTEFMHLMNLHNYEIKDHKFKELIKKFTITAHKEAAGKIGGFEVESGSAPGDITFF
ncbi:MAG: hypothetical protein J6R67_07420 [Treponema sp.]|nr:hypothetical protein [Treponema sp.]